MDKYITGAKGKIADASDTNQTKSANGDVDQPWKPKSRKYDDSYLTLGFTPNVVGDEERPVCVLCLKTPTADSMKPNKLNTWRLYTPHASKPLKIFKRKLDEYLKQENRFKKTASVTNKAQLAS